MHASLWLPNALSDGIWRRHWVNARTAKARPKKPPSSRPFMFNGVARHRFLHTYTRIHIPYTPLTFLCGAECVTQHWRTEGGGFLLPLERLGQHWCMAGLETGVSPSPHTPLGRRCRRDKLRGCVAGRSGSNKKGVPQQEWQMTCVTSLRGKHKERGVCVRCCCR